MTAIANEPRLTRALPGRSTLPLGLLLALFVAGFLHALLAPYASGAAATAAPLSPPDLSHPFGTDVLGRDVWSETLHALSVTLSAAWFATILALGFGPLAGLVAAHLVGRFGGVMRLVANVLVSLPALLLAVLISALLVPGSAPVAAGLAVAPAAFLRSYDRARRELSASYSDFARASGISALALFRRDLAHETRDALFPTAARVFAAVTVTISTMSFLGFGAMAPNRDLGLMIASARGDLPFAWWSVLGPMFFLVLLILAARLVAGLSAGERP